MERKIIMLEIRDYAKPELSAMFGTRNMENLKRKMERYGITFEVNGRGENAVLTASTENTSFTNNETGAGLIFTNSVNEKSPHSAPPAHSLIFFVFLPHMRPEKYKIMSPVIKFSKNKYSA